MEENNFFETTEAFHGDEDTLRQLRDKSVVWEIEDYYDRNAPTLRAKIEELLTM
jgi:hypothetical protein